MIERRPRLSVVLTLGVGVLVGWVVGAMRAPRVVLAAGGDRWNDRIVTSGPIAIEQNALKVAVPHDALYYLNYNTGTLLATIPSVRQAGLGTQVLSEFAERDLVRDFELGPGVSPHFLMVTGTLGALSEGWAPLYVFETETGQVAAYKLSTQFTAGSSKPSFQLLERRSDPRLGKARTAAR